MTTTTTKTKKPMRRRLGRDLAALRQGAGVTQAKLAEASSIPLGSIQAMETGRFHPSLDHIRSYLALEAPVRAPLERQLCDIRAMLEELLARVGTPAGPLVEVEASEPAPASAPKPEWNVVATFTLAGCDVEVRTLEAAPGAEGHTGVVWRSTNREHLFSPHEVSGVEMACRDAIRAIAEELTGPLPLHCPFWTEVPLIVPHQDGTYPPGAAFEYPYVKVASTDTGWVAEAAINGIQARASGPTAMAALIPLLLARAGLYGENADGLQGYNLKFDDTTTPPTVTATPCSDEVE